MSPNTQRPPTATAAVYFDDPETAYDALLAWRRERGRLEARRDPLVLGALRVFPEHGGEAVAVRGTGLSRGAIRRIEEAGQDKPVVTEPRWPNVDMYAEVLLVQADRLSPPPETEPETTEQYTLRRVQQMCLQSLARRIRKTPPDDLELQGLTADLLSEAAEMRSGAIDTYEGSLRRSAQEQQGNSVIADLIETAVAQITEYRLRGDDATEDLDPTLVAKARQRIAEHQSEGLAELAGSDRYAHAITQGTLIHGTAARDATASDVLRAARRVRDLEQELAQIREDLLQGPPDAEPEDEPRRDALRAVAAADPDVRQAMATVLGAEATEDLLADQGDAA
jgi:hypothetical protein